MKYYEIRLVENQAQYKQMLAGMVANEIITADTADNVVKNARVAFKRNDRIIWFLRWYRLTEVHEKIYWILSQSKFQHRADELKQMFQRITKSDYDSMSEAEMRVFRNRFINQFSMEHISHALTIPAINQMQWDINATPLQIYNRILDLEAEHNAKQQAVVGVKPGDKIVLDYGKYAWVLLNRGACKDEADAMGHCGNVPSERSGDRILSFRSIVDGENQKPHLTFILNKDGKLGEMKGRANQKPNKKYHQYIVDLIKQDFIKGITGGGYAPENNFAIWDLQPKLMLDLINNKPDLIPTVSDFRVGKENVPPEVQPVLVKADPNWVLHIKNLIPELKPLRRKLVYAVVTEPGLTDLVYKQYLTRDEYEKAREWYPAFEYNGEMQDSFVVKFMQK